LHYETASTTQQPRGEHRGTIKDCKIAGAITWQRQSNHTFTTAKMPICPMAFFEDEMRMNPRAGKVQQIGQKCHAAIPSV